MRSAGLGGDGGHEAIHTIAGNDKELILVGEVVDLDVGRGRDDLVLGRQLSALLELEVADSARQSKVAVDAAKVDKASSGRDTVLLGYTSFVSIGWLFRSVYPSGRLTLELGLVVVGQGLGATLDAEDGSRVTGVGL